MHNYYEDILSKISEKPLWWDENAVPRFAPFTYDQCANIYADEKALVQIACQSCGALFSVAMSCSRADVFMRETRLGEPCTLEFSIKNGSLHYGDPPNARCCPSGPTMNCLDLRVLEYWRRGDQFKWERDPSLEISLPDCEEAENYAAATARPAPADTESRAQ